MGVFCAEVVGGLSWRDWGGRLVSSVRMPSCGHFLHHPKSLQAMLGVGSAQGSGLCSSSILQRPELPAPLFSPPPPQVFFTRNGKIIGKKDAVVPSGGFFPTIGMLSCGEKVKVDLHPLSG